MTWWRWWCVLPVALVASQVTRFVIGLTMRQAIATGWSAPGQSDVSFAVALVLLYIPKEWAFVVAGAWVAPRYQRPTATTLAVVAGTLSLAKHILLQQHVGWVNWMHFTAELTGAVMGAVSVRWRQRRETTL